MKQLIPDCIYAGPCRYKKRWNKFYRPHTVKCGMYPDTCNQQRWSWSITHSDISFLDNYRNKGWRSKLLGFFVGAKKT